MIGKFTISAINVNGLRDRTSQGKANTICHLSKTSNSNLTFLLDTRLDQSLESRLTKSYPWPGNVLFAHNENHHSAGIAVLIKEDLPINRIIRDPKGRYLMLDITTTTANLLIVAVRCMRQRRISPHEKCFSMT